jgi:hypothetical protein
MARRTIPSRVTARWVKRHDPCDEGLQAFKEVFPNGAAITKASVRKALANGLDVGWFLGSLIDEDDWTAVECGARDEYREWRNGRGDTEAMDAKYLDLTMARIKAYKRLLADKARTKKKKKKKSA